MQHQQTNYFKYTANNNNDLVHQEINVSAAESFFVFFILLP